MDDLDALLDRFAVVRKFSSSLCAPLRTEDFVVQSMPDASPTKWHLAHTTWFFDTFVLLLLRGHAEGGDGYHHLFNSYYNTVGSPFPRPRRGTISRPTVDEVRDYRKRVDVAVQVAMRDATGDARRVAARNLTVGIHHEQQHQELLLTDIKHALGHHTTRPAYDEALTVPEASRGAAKMIALEGGVSEVGYDGDGFAYDSERPRHRVLVEDYLLSSRLVTNAEFCEFIDDGGYEQHALWLDEGWSRVGDEGWRAPLYWEEREDGWHSYTLAGPRPLDPEAPVCHVSFFEADAFARWRGKRLPTEEEWELAASAAAVGSRGTLVDDGDLHPVGRASEGPIQHLVGEVWEWTASAYRPYRGFAPLDGALGEYNGKFMSGQMVLRGGSCATSASHIRPTYRNFFQPEKRWQFSGFRLAE